MSISTDLLTPLGAYLRLREGAAASFLLESVEQGRLGRHSFIGSGAELVSFEEAERLDVPVVGYLSYDHVARLEPSVTLPADGPDLPESRFVVAETLVRFDHGSGTADVLAGDEDGIAARLEADLVVQEHTPSVSAAVSRDAISRHPQQAVYEEGVRRIKERIRAGEAFQVVLSQRAERRTSASALALYRALRRVNPSPYLFLLELGELALVGSSPETLVKCEAGRASLNPIAGTTHPGDGDAERLLDSAKDRAEHVMLVDLGRNDLSRVCKPATVHVERFLEPERFSHVTHLVSEVAGELRDGVTPFDLLRACFPAGTVSGAPKVRAMEIIAELEPERRGIYSGTVGYVDFAGNLDF
ncbi:MAG: anthranilate synthase component I family protein, partial [Gaiellaceae bacterium]